MADGALMEILMGSGGRIMRIGASLARANQKLLEFDCRCRSAAMGVSLCGARGWGSIRLFSSLVVCQLRIQSLKQHFVRSDHCLSRLCSAFQDFQGLIQVELPEFIMISRQGIDRMPQSFQMLGHMIGVATLVNPVLSDAGREGLCIIGLALHLGILGNRR